MKPVGEMLKNVREKTPLVHFITNYVTVNDCANITLACGGSPIMADEKSEVEEMTSLCSALVINIGTANLRTLDSMICAGRHANDLDIPVILDPAGVGASSFRNNAVNLLLQEINFSIIKGNISEIKFLSDGIISTQGVDASKSDLVNEDNLPEAVTFARKISMITGSVIVITGPIDIIADSTQAYAIYNGHPSMPLVTGTGCMSAALLGCFAGANPDVLLDAAVASTALMGICGETAYLKKEQTGVGLSTFRSLLIDSVGDADAKLLEEKIRIRHIPANTTQA